MTNVRIAQPHEFDRIAALYDEMVADMAHSAFDPHWNREDHPNDEFLKRSLEQGQLIVCEHDGALAGALVLNHEGADGYEGTPWKVDAPESEASVIHVLCTLPRLQGNGLGRALLRYRARTRASLRAPRRVARQYAGPEALRVGRVRAHQGNRAALPRRLVRFRSLRMPA